MRMSAKQFNSVCKIILMEKMKRNQWFKFNCEQDNIGHYPKTMPGLLCKELK